MNASIHRAVLAVLVLALVAASCKGEPVAPGTNVTEQGGSSMKIQQEHFGRLADGTGVDLYTLTNKAGLEARITTYGAILVSLKVPDRKGVLADVNLGFDTLDPAVSTGWASSCTTKVVHPLAR